MPSLCTLLQPATGITPGFRAHLKHPLPELPRIALGLWALNWPVALVLGLLVGDLRVPARFGDSVTRSLLFWLMCGAGLCAIVWINPWPAMAMRSKADWRSALGDLLGMTYIALLPFLFTSILVPSYADYSTRVLTGELLLRATETRETVAEQLLAKQAITPRQMQLPSTGPTPAQQWLGVEAEGRIWLFRSDLPALMWLTPQIGPEGVRWHCRGMGKPGHFPAACREGADALSR